MSATGRLWGLILLPLTLACASKNTMNVSAGHDAGSMGSAETGLSEDAKTAVPDRLALPDLAVGPDIVASKADADSPDSQPLPDLAAGSDIVASKADADSPTKSPDALLVFLDGKMLSDTGPDTAKADGAKDLGPQGSDAGVTVSGVQVIPYKDFGTADSTCVDGTTSWMAALTTYLAEDRKCWSDADCQYISISNSCGQVCPMPINVQRIGEFANHAIGDLDPKCSTCPQLTDYPSCNPPPGDGSVICSNSQCVWK